MIAAVPTSLYRHFAADGSLLYVGISLSWPARTKAHAHGSPWFEQVAKVEIERFPDRAAALLAEREAIKREKPKFNVIHNRQVEEAAVATPVSRTLPSQRSATDPLLRKITGPDAIVGPALVYGRDAISVMIAHGAPGTAGELTEVILGEYFGDAPEWSSVFVSVLTIRKPNQITMKEAREIRLEIVDKLRKNLRRVHAFDTDLGLAVAYASTFPSEKSRRILDDVATQKGAA